MASQRSHGATKSDREQLAKRVARHSPLFFQGHFAERKRESKKDGESASIRGAGEGEGSRVGRDGKGTAVYREEKMGFLPRNGDYAEENQSK